MRNSKDLAKAFAARTSARACSLEQLLHPNCSGHKVLRLTVKQTNWIRDRWERERGLSGNREAQGQGWNYRRDPNGTAVLTVFEWIK